MLFLIGYIYCLSNNPPQIVLFDSSSLNKIPPAYCQFYNYQFHNQPSENNIKLSPHISQVSVTNFITLCAVFDGFPGVMMNCYFSLI